MAQGFPGPGAVKGHGTPTEFDSCYRAFGFPAGETAEIVFHITPAKGNRIGDFQARAGETAFPAEMLEKFMDGEIVAGEDIAAARFTLLCGQSVPDRHVPNIGKVERAVKIARNLP